MSLTEILVLAGGLVLGYWVVSEIIGNASTEEQRLPGSHPPPQPQADSDTVLPWHEVLNVSPDASAEEIRSSYQALIQQHHPDRVADLDQELKVVAERKSRAINAAFEQAMRGR